MFINEADITKQQTGITKHMHELAIKACGGTRPRSLHGLRVSDLMFPGLGLKGLRCSVFCKQGQFHFVLKDLHVSQSTSRQYWRVKRMGLS